MSAEPISNLDERLTDLVVALQEVRALEEVVVGLRAYEAVLGLVPVGDPSAITALGLARVWSALADTADEILKLREVANGSA